MKKIKVNSIAILARDGKVYDVLTGDNITIFYEENKAIYSSEKKKITAELKEEFTTEER